MRLNKDIEQKLLNACPTRGVVSVRGTSSGGAEIVTRTEPLIVKWSFSIGAHDVHYAAIVPNIDFFNRTAFLYFLAEHSAVMRDQFFSGLPPGCAFCEAENPNQ